MWWIAQSVPPELAGLPTWALNGLSVGSLVMFIVVGLVTSRLWTKSQVDNVITRYETHLKRTIELYQGRVDDSNRREQEWREIAQKWQTTAETLSRSLEQVQEQSATSLAILQAWQIASQRPGRGRQ